MGDSGITKEYLENILKEPVGKFVVKEGSNLGDGFTCAMLSVDVWMKSNPDSENPRRIVIKCFPANASRQEMLDKGNCFVIELGVYQEIIPALTKFQEELGVDAIPLPVPPCIYGNHIPPNERKGQEFNPLDNCIVMPDMRSKSNGGFRLRDRFLGLDLDHYRLVIEAQATLHALSWAWQCKTKKKLEEEFPYLKVDYVALLKSFQLFVDSGIDTCGQVLREFPEQAKALEQFKKINTSVCELYFGFTNGPTANGDTKDNLLRVPGIVKPDEEPWPILLHGDCHSNNHMFRYDEKTGRPVEVILLDLQQMRVADQFCDINYTLFVSGAPDMRQKHLKSMLHVYYDTFTSICDKLSVPYLPRWSWEEFNRRMRRAKLFGAYMAAMSFPLVLKNPDEFKNLDESADATDTKKVGSKDGIEDAAEFFTQLAATKTPSAALTERIKGVMEDLIEDGVL